MFTHMFQNSCAAIIPAKGVPAPRNAARAVSGAGTAAGLNKKLPAALVGSGELVSVFYTFSQIVATPIPPPMQRVARPRLQSSRLSIA